MSTVIINGKKYTSNGGGISVINNKVYIDGKLASDENNSVAKVINITVEGNVNGNVQNDVGNVTVNGNTKDVKATSGEVKITGNVEGNVNTASGDVEIGGSIYGSVTTASGDVSVKGCVNGAVKSLSGDVKEENRGAFRKTVLDLI